MPNETYPKNGVYDIRAYGAVGDGKFLNTKPIQSAIDECAKNGGGTVEIPAGVWITGTLWLRSHVHLHLAHAAILRGSTNKEDYNENEAFPQNGWSVAERASGAHLIIGLEVEDVAITGEGTIDGSEEAFRGKLLQPEPHWQRQEEVFNLPDGWRPGQMVYIVESRDIMVRGIKLINSPYWTLLFHGCANVRVDSLSIYVDRRVPNGDGIGIDCCRNVVVTNCLIDSSDDCVTVRANGKRLLHSKALSENITVSNCVFRTKTCGIRIGVGDGHIRNVVCSNIVATDVMSGIHISGKWTPASPGVLVENIRFSNFSIRARVAIHIASGFGAVKPVRSIFFTNIDAECDSASYIGGSPECPVTDVHFDNVRLRMFGGSNNSKEYESLYAIYSRARSYSRRAVGMPFAIYMEYTQGVQFDRMRIEWEENRINGVWKNSILAYHCKEPGFHNIRTGKPPSELGGAVLRLEHTPGTLIKGCATYGEDTLFLETDEVSREGLVLIANEFD